MNDIKDNTALAGLDRLSNKGIMDKKLIFRKSEEMRKAMHIKTPDVFERVGNLSGGESAEGDACQMDCDQSRRSDPG